MYEKSGPVCKQWTQKSDSDNLPPRPTLLITTLHSILNQQRKNITQDRWLIETLPQFSYHRLFYVASIFKYKNKTVKVTEEIISF